MYHCLFLSHHRLLTKRRRIQLSSLARYQSRRTPENGLSTLKTPKTTGRCRFAPVQRPGNMDPSSEAECTCTVDQNQLLRSSNGLKNAFIVEKARYCPRKDLEKIVQTGRTLTSNEWHTPGSITHYSEHITVKDAKRCKK